MISDEEIKAILKKPESSILDFKEDFYDLSNEKDLKNTSKFIKDVISFSNTIRNDKGFIIFGIRENTDKSLELIGLNDSFDDSILQEKIKDKVFPRPFFLYYEISYDNFKLGVLEFPITKYELPLTPAVKMKGLEVGKVYYRNGTSNTEANAIDIIRINDWLKSLPGNLKLALSDKISEILKRITLDDEKLSVIMTDILNVSKIHSLSKLESFCSSQIVGISNEDIELHKYRKQKVFFSLSDVKINQFSPINVTTDLIRGEMRNSDNFFETEMLFNYTLIQIEEMLSHFENNKSFATIKMSVKCFLPEIKEDYDVNVFIFDQNLKSLYSNVKQKAIDELMKI